MFKKHLLLKSPTTAEELHIDYRNLDVAKHRCFVQKSFLGAECSMVEKWLRSKTNFPFGVLQVQFLSIDKTRYISFLQNSIQRELYDVLNIGRLS